MGVLGFVQAGGRSLSWRSLTCATSTSTWCPGLLAESGCVRVAGHPTGLGIQAEFLDDAFLDMGADESVDRRPEGLIYP